MKEMTMEGAVEYQEQFTALDAAVAVAIAAAAAAESNVLFPDSCECFQLEGERGEEDESFMLIRM